MVVDGVIESRGEPHGPQHTQMILAKPCLRVANSADHAIPKIILATDKIQNFMAVRIEQQSVDGEIAAQYVLAWIGFEGDSSRMPAIHISVVAAESGHLDLRVVLPDQNHTEVGTDEAGTRE